MHIYDLRSPSAFTLSPPKLKPALEPTNPFLCVVTCLKPFYQTVTTHSTPPLEDTEVILSVLRSEWPKRDYLTNPIFSPIGWPAEWVILNLSWSFRKTLKRQCWFVGFIANKVRWLDQHMTFIKEREPSQTGFTKNRKFYMKYLVERWGKTLW